jgi:putative nucleotidyltransferase with HDIG domain
LLSTHFLTAANEEQAYEALAGFLPLFGIKIAMMAFLSREKNDPLSWQAIILRPNEKTAIKRFQSHDFPPADLAGTETFHLAVLPLAGQDRPGTIGFVAFEDTNLSVCATLARQLLSVCRRKEMDEELALGVRKLLNALEGSIKAMALTVETRDPHTAGHQRRVAQLAEAIAVEIKLPKDRIEGVRLAALVHDIGKIGIPAEILSKPGSLHALEFAFIKNHPQKGYDILKTIEFPWPIAEIVRQHHGRLNGSGYPPLSGEEIILEARIIGVADVVEAMCFHRPYRPALGIDVAFKEITAQRGILYDPGVVDACLGLFNEKDFKFVEEWDDRGRVK